MDYQEKIVTLKDGTECRICSPKKKDAAQILEHMKIITEETHHMIRYPDEIEKNLEEEEQCLEESLKSETDLMIAAFIGDELAGNAKIFSVGTCKKIRHRAIFVVSVKKKYWGRGIGWTLLQAIIGEAKKMGYDQLELNVFSDNKSARALYKKAGFEEWGCIKNAFRLKNGSRYDAIVMGKIL